MTCDVLVIGCGLTGSVIARQLAEKGKKVTVWDRRNHIAGNMFDYVDRFGVLVHKYGPHTFHTTKKKLFDYMSKFGEWEEFRLTCGAKIDDHYTPTPFNFDTIDMFYKSEDANIIKNHVSLAFGEQKTVTVVELLEHKDEIIRNYANFLFKKDYAPYTAKQWGVSPKEIDPSILKRVPVRFSYDEGYFDDEFQVMPKRSYTNFFKNLLNHQSIKVELETEALNYLRIQNNVLYLNNSECSIPVVYTGALDELFSNIEGALPYRSLRFEWIHEDIESKQPYPVVAYPQAEGYTRITEYKKMPVQYVKGTTYAVEYPLQYDASTKQEPYYPLLTEKSIEQYEKYKKLTEKVNNLYPCGRLADYKYYNMDQALERALQVAEKIISMYSNNF